MKIEEVLLKVNHKELIYAVGTKKIVQLEKLLNSKLSDSSQDLIKAVISIFGQTLFFQSKIRHLIFFTLEPEILRHLAVKYAKKVYDKPYDNALNLSLLPWKVGSEFVSEIADILSLSEEYLPSKIDINFTVERVIPNKPFFPLHDYQEELKESLIAELNSNSRRFLLQMPTGQGKQELHFNQLFHFKVKNDFLKMKKL